MAKCIETCAVHCTSILPQAARKKDIRIKFKGFSIYIVSKSVGKWYNLYREEFDNI